MHFISHMCRTVTADQFQLICHTASLWGLSNMFETTTKLVQGFL